MQRRQQQGSFMTKIRHVQLLELLKDVDGRVMEGKLTTRVAPPDHLRQLIDTVICR